MRDVVELQDLRDQVLVRLEEGGEFLAQGLRAYPAAARMPRRHFVLPHRLLQAEEARKVCPHALPVPVFESLHRDDVERLRPEGENPAEDVDLRSEVNNSE